MLVQLLLSYVDSVVSLCLETHCKLVVLALKRFQHTVLLSSVFYDSLQILLRIFFWRDIYNLFGWQCVNIPFDLVRYRRMMIVMEDRTSCYFSEVLLPLTRLSQSFSFFFYFRSMWLFRKNFARLETILGDQQASNLHRCYLLRKW